MRKRILTTVLVATGLATPAVLAETIAYHETDWAPGNWSAATPFVTAGDWPGFSYSVVTDRFATDEPTGWFMLSQFVFDVPANHANRAYAPVMLTGWTHDPQTDGEILNLSASVRTFPATAPTTGGLGRAQLILEQGGTYFMLSPLSPNFQTNFPDFAEHDTDTAPDMYRTATNLTPTDFMEVSPDSGVNFWSYPDFAGSPIQFGFGYSMTTTDIDGAGPTTLMAAFDSASIRMNVVPEPGALSLLALGGLTVLRRRPGV